MSNEETIFTGALGQLAREQRSAFLDQACGGDTALRSRVEVLLAAHEQAGSFLEAPPAGVASIVHPPDRTLSPAEKAGSVIGPYKLLEQIGEGGMGVVFMAEQLHPVRRRVAVKIIKPGLDSKQVIARLEAERQALAMMDHPNIAKVFDAGATDTGRPYFVMELVRGIPITEFCDQHRLTPRERLELFVQVCEAVQHAHQKGIIHRDLKPNNVLVTLQDGDRPMPKVIDFGVAKATAGQRLTEQTLFTEFRQLIGTPLYMSPEQTEMSALLDLDTRSDVYSLGVLLYELLTGSTPFDKHRLAKAAYDEVRRIIREEEPPRPSTRISTLGQTLTTVSAQRQTDPRKLSTVVRGELDWIVMRALEKDRARRYSTAAGFAQDIERYLADEPVEACPPSRFYRVRKLVRRNKPAIVTATAIVVVLLLATAISTWQAVRATRAEKQVTFERDHVLDEKRRADEQAAVAQAVNDFFSTDVLAQASPEGQASVKAPNPNLTVREALDRAANGIAGKFDKHPLVEAAISSTIGRAYLDLGYFANAEPHLQSAVDLYTQVLGPSHIQTLKALGGLAHLYSSQRDYTKAESLDLKILQLAPKGSDLVIIVTGDLGGLYSDQNMMGKAEPLLVKALELQRQAHGDQDRRTLLILDNIAVFYQHKRQFAKAEAMHLQALEGLRKLLGEKNPATLHTLVNLAGCYFDQGRYKDAETLYVRALAVEREVLGEHSYETIKLMNYLAWNHYSQKHYAEAERLWRDKLTILKQNEGEESANVISDLIDLGGVLLVQGRKDNADELFRQAIATQQKATGPESSEVGATMVTVALKLRYQNRNGDAEKFFRQAIPLLLKSDPGSYLSDALHTLGHIDRERGDLGRAEQEYKEALAIRRKVYSDDSIPVADAVGNVGRTIMLSRTRYAEAEKAFKEALEIEQRAGPPDNPNIAAYKNLLGEALSLQGRFSDSEPLLLDACSRIYARASRAESWDRRDNLKWIIDLYRRWNKPERADRWLEGLKASGKQDPDALGAIDALAGIYQSEGRLPDAERLRRDLLDIREKMNGPESLEVAKGLVLLADVEMNQDHNDEAGQIILRALVILRKGQDEVALADGIHSLGNITRRQGNVAESDKLFSEELEIRRKAEGPYSGHLASPLANLGENRLRNHEYAKAGRLFEQALDILQHIDLPDDPTIARYKSFLGETLLLQGKYAEAEHLLLAADEVLQIRRPGTRDSRDNLNRIVTLYSKWGKPDLADLWRAKGFEAEVKSKTQAIATLTDTDTNLPGLLSDRALLYWRLGRPKEADADIARLTQLVNADAPAAVRGRALYERGSTYARLGGFRRAADDLDKAIDLGPEDVERWHEGVPLLLQVGDETGYRRRQSEELRRFGDTKDARTAHVVAKDSLLLPIAGEELRIAAELAERGVSRTKPTRPGVPGETDVAYYLTKGMAEYRLGHIQAAMPWLLKAKADRAYFGVQSRFFMAMAFHRLGQTREAHEALADAEQTMQASLPTPGKDLLAGGQYNMAQDWVQCQFLRREAEELINGKGPTTNPIVSTQPAQ